MFHITIFSARTRADKCQCALLSHFFLLFASSIKTCLLLHDFDCTDSDLKPAGNLDMICEDVRGAGCSFSKAC